VPFFVQCCTKRIEASIFMQYRTKKTGRGRPRKFDEREALHQMQRTLWTTGLSGASLDAIARSADLNRPSLAAAFGDKDAIYVKAAADYVAMIDDRLRRALAHADLAKALQAAFDAALDIYTAAGPDGCFIMCTAPAEAVTNPVCRAILDQALEASDALFLGRLEQAAPGAPGLPAFASLLGATLHSLALRARADWSRARLHTFTTGAVAHVVGALERKARSTISGRSRGPGS
jgi:AcrR family transcriptional regulator